MSKKIVVKKIFISGATDGIGLLTAEKLAEQGHSLLIHGRNQEKLKKVASKLTQLGADSVESYEADLSRFEELKDLAYKILQKHRNLDVLINNAGVFKSNMPTTDYGFDLRIAVNTLAPHYLIKKLAAIMARTGRIINLSSAAQAPVNLNFLSGAQNCDDELSAYAQSKLALTMLSTYFAKLYEASGPSVVAINPGSLLGSKMVKEGFGLQGKDLNIGADILVRAALSQAFESASGRYFDNDIGDFSNPHQDAENLEKCEELYNRVETILASKIKI